MSSRLSPDQIPPTPDLTFEQALWKEGLSLIAGIDEAGRGCLAGPVAAAAVILPATPTIDRDLAGVLDSKVLSPGVREQLRHRIESRAVCWAVAYAGAAEIDRWGIVPATRLAISRALQALPRIPDHLLVDYLDLPEQSLPQTRLVKGDARSLSIAAASILAKTHRDGQMTSLADRYPQYDLAGNKGYGTAVHRQALEEHGPSPEHRMTFAPLKFG